MAAISQLGETVPVRGDDPQALATRFKAQLLERHPTWKQGTDVFVSQSERELFHEVRIKALPRERPGFLLWVWLSRDTSSRGTRVVARVYHISYESDPKPQTVPPDEYLERLLIEVIDILYAL